MLIFDEVFVGFRLAAGGAQEYFGVRADMVTYGKTLGGGLPVGVVCGRSDLMQRFRDDRPVDICFARGTFNSHPYVMAAMDEFLQPARQTPDVAASTTTSTNLERPGASSSTTPSQRERPAGPGRQPVLDLDCVLTPQPSRYNWMLQYYLRAEGLALSWVGTGRLIFSLNYTDADFAEVADRFVAAAAKMKQDGWWWHAGFAHQQEHPPADPQGDDRRRLLALRPALHRPRQGFGGLPSLSFQTPDRSEYRCPGDPARTSHRLPGHHQCCD